MESGSQQPTMESQFPSSPSLDLVPATRTSQSQIGDQCEELCEALKDNRLHKNASIDELFTKFNDLLKKGETNIVKVMIENMTPSDLVDRSTGVTLLHMAARYNNVELINLLVSSGCDKDSKTSSGATPLLISAMHCSFDAVKYFLDANADVLAADKDNVSPLRYLLENGKKLPAWVSASLRERLRRDLDGAEKTVNNESQLMRQALEEDLFDRKFDCEGFVELAVDMSLLESIKILVLYSTSREIKKLLLKKLATTMTDPNADLELVKPIVEKLVDWRVIDKQAMEPLRTIYRGGSEKAVRMLIDFGVDSYVKSFLGRHFLTHMFQNTNLDVLKLLKNRWGINERGRRGCTLLHFAVRFKPTSFVRRLLDLGANPNIRNSEGRTPLFFVNNSDCMELLLLRGADILVEDKRMNKVFKVLKKKTRLLQIAVVYLADLVSCQDPIDFEALTPLNDDRVHRMFRQFRGELNWMEDHSIYRRYLTLYGLYKAKDKDVISFRYDSREVVLSGIEYMRENEFNPYLIERVERQAKRAFEFYPMKLEIANTVAECLEVNGPNHLVVEKIVGFLTMEDIFACL